MAANKVRADYDELAEIAGSFDCNAGNIHRILHQLHKDLDLLLEGDWVGRGSAEFYREMISDVLPSVKRLGDALERAARDTRQMSRIMKQAEEDSARLFTIDWAEYVRRLIKVSGPAADFPGPFDEWIQGFLQWAQRQLDQWWSGGISLPAPTLLPFTPAPTAPASPTRSPTAASPTQTPSAPAATPTAGSREAIEFIARFEGVELALYDDPSGNCTIGAGHLVHLGPCDGQDSEAGFADGITEARAYDLLAEDVADAERAVDDLVTVPLTQNQYDALVSFTFNVGRGNFESSDLLSRLNSGEYGAVPDELSRWVYGSDGAVLEGLQTRREQEGRIFSDGIYGEGP